MRAELVGRIGSLCAFFFYPGPGLLLTAFLKPVEAISIRVRSDVKFDLRSATFF